METDGQAGGLYSDEGIGEYGSCGCLNKVLKESSPVDFDRLISTGSRGIEIPVLFMGIKIADGYTASCFKCDTLGSLLHPFSELVLHLRPGEHDIRILCPVEKHLFFRLRLGHVHPVAFCYLNKLCRSASIA